ncbi:putative MFS family arabinose efflux permease [Motilibacter rhizosphaerae]|uniref:Putative MFS family arabinose efflux permease n=1 Tax=Motilibacter rhizosphaerae TaxID=598652 RepID=A0A4V2F4J8_9ACTN|nr:MFS transporter [Motilibacter rhizosphaerae]RZS89569.1 putative MFS family arabinose efflux permease [Motilibacter rhizosphaerae]
MVSADAAGVATYRGLLRHREFTSLWGSDAVSLVGDQLAAVALSVLVFARTGSTLATAATYAVAFLPAIVGGPLLAGLADVLPRRTVMLACDALRAVLVALMAVPGMPLAVLLVLLVVVALVGSAFSAARSALMADVLQGEAYVLASSLTSTTAEASLVGGFLLGGVGVAAFGARGCLLLDAASFVASAVLVLLVRHRPAVREAPLGRRLVAPGLLDGVRLVFATPQLRWLTLLAWLCAFYVVPEALAVPYAHAHGGGPRAAGVLLAANPLGTVLGSFALVKLATPARRMQLMGPMALVASLVLVACAASPPWPVVAVLLLVSGAGSAYNLPANAAFVAALPNERRGAAFGVVATGMSAGQGLTLLVAGAVGEVVSPGAVMALAGAAGALVSLPVLLGLRSVFVAEGDRG